MGLGGYESLPTFIFKTSKTDKYEEGRANYFFEMKSHKKFVLPMQAVCEETAVHIWLEPRVKRPAPVDLQWLQRVFFTNALPSD